MRRLRAFREICKERGVSKGISFVFDKISDKILSRKHIVCKKYGNRFFRVCLIIDHNLGGGANKYRNDLMNGYIYKIYLSPTGEVVYDIQIGGECPAVINNIPEIGVVKKK